MHWNAKTLDTKFSICWTNSCTVNGLRILDIDFVQQEYWIISVRSSSENADTLLASIYSSGRADASAARRMQEEMAKSTKQTLGEGVKYWNGRSVENDLTRNFWPIQFSHACVANASLCNRIDAYVASSVPMRLCGEACLCGGEGA